MVRLFLLSSLGRNSLLGALVLLLPSPAIAHDAPSGWTYPPACCSGLDCRAVPADMITANEDGYMIETTGELMSYADSRVRPSPDGEHHWCSVGGSDTGRTLCLFVPPPGS